jgi:hypothetical protein
MLLQIETVRYALIPHNGLLEHGAAGRSFAKVIYMIGLLDRQIDVHRAPLTVIQRLMSST